MMQPRENPTMNDANSAHSSFKRTLQTFFGQRSVQVALVVIFGIATLAIALLGRYIAPYYLASDTQQTADLNEDQPEEIPQAFDGQPAPDTVGGTASRDVYATHAFNYISLRDADIGERRKEAWESVLPIWQANPQATLELYRKVRRAFDRGRQQICNDIYGNEGTVPLVDEPQNQDDANDEKPQTNLDNPSENNPTVGPQVDERIAYQQCIKYGLEPDKLTDEQREKLTCNDVMRTNFKKILHLKEFTQEHCDVFVVAGLHTDLRTSLEGYLDDNMFKNIVKDDDALETLRQSIDTNLSAEAHGVELRRATEDASTEDATPPESQLITDINVFHTIEEARIAAAKDTENTLPERWDENTKDAVRTVVAQLIQPNTFYDANATEEARKTAAGRKYNRHQTTHYPRGQLLLHKDDVITPHDAEVINQMNVTAPRIVNRYWEALGLALLLFLTATTLWSVSSEDKHQWATRDITMMGLVLLLQIALIRVGFELSGQAAADGKPTVYAIAILTILPFGAGPLVVKSLTSSRNAFAFTAMASVLVAAISRYDITWFGVSLVAGFAGASTLHAIEKRSSIVRAAGFSALATLTAVLALTAVGRIGDGGTTILVTVLAVGIGFLLTSLISLGLPTLLEFTFRYTTRSSLLELLNDEHPLRAKLHNAPGTMAHSLAVADLASNACRKIGANALLARVGCTFHDVGKLRAPGYFGENNPEHNPHNECDARESAARIIDHVKHGVEDAKKYGLPKEVIDFIQTHHGTMLVEHFYNVTCENEGTHNVDKQEFRYPGPLPQTKETGICLMADGVEAMVRAMPDKSAENIARVVRKKIAAVRVQGQLIDSGLTLREVQVVEDSLIEQLRTTYHKRPTYAKAPKNAETTP